MAGFFRWGSGAAGAPGPDALTRTLAAGARTALDAVAPAAVEVERDHLVLDGRTYVRTYVLTGYPRQVTPGWFAALLELDQELDVAIHVVPLAPGDVMARLDA
ncbi:MAG TPA: hypothetical protein VIO14_06955, partial [Dehalococcoidia bacterium]